jgi:hypothetical protein
MKWKGEPQADLWGNMKYEEWGGVCEILSHDGQ